VHSVGVVDGECRGRKAVAARCASRTGRNGDTIQLRATARGWRLPWESDGRGVVGRRQTKGD
jgi:hypothetical protein